VDYRQSGVDIDAGNEVVRRIKQMTKKTYTAGVLSGVGSFGGLFAPDGSVAGPELRADAGGVGTDNAVEARTQSRFPIHHLSRLRTLSKLQT